MPRQGRRLGAGVQPRQERRRRPSGPPAACAGGSTASRAGAGGRCRRPGRGSRARTAARCPGSRCRRPGRRRASPPASCGSGRRRGRSGACRCASPSGLTVSTSTIWTPRGGRAERSARSTGTPARSLPWMAPTTRIRRGARGAADPARDHGPAPLGVGDHLARGRVCDQRHARESTLPRMRIDETIERLDRPVFSFEFFPPKTDEGFANLRTTLDALRNDAPDFVSVTYGALGTTRDRTLDIVKWIKQDLDIEAMAHFTCVGATREELSRDAARDGRVRRGQRAGPARRPAPGRDRVEAHRGRAALLDRADRAAPGRVRVRRRRRRVPRGAPRGRERPVRPGVPEGQAGRRRQLLHHPAVLRQRVLLRLRGQGARHRASRCRSSRASCP